MAERQRAVRASEIVPRVGSNYPGALAEPCKSREKRALGNVFNLDQFGVNQTTLPPGAWSSLRHWHAREDEFIYVLDGEVTLIDEAGEYVLTPGMCAGFKAGTPNGHHLINRSSRTATILEVGTRARDDDATYPGIDLKAVKRNGGPWQSQRRDGTPY